VVVDDIGEEGEDDDNMVCGAWAPALGGQGGH